MTDYKAKFRIGQIVHHKLFDYTGVIFDIDPFFQSSDEWYEQVAQSRPPKNKPWYHVLVHTAEHTTYVAEQNLDLEENPKAFGVFGYSFLEQNKDKLQGSMVEGNAPTFENISSGVLSDAIGITSITLPTQFKKKGLS